MLRILAVVVLTLCLHGVAHAQDESAPTSQRITQLILQADAEFDVDVRAAVRTVREAQQIDSSSRVSRVARISLRYGLRPGAALTLDAIQLQQVIDHNGTGSLFRVLGYVVGALGAVGGAWSLVIAMLAVEWERSWGRSGAPSDDLQAVVGGLGGGGILFALIGVMFQVTASQSDDEARLLLEVAPTDASLGLVLRF